LRPLIISDDVKALGLIETLNDKNDKYCTPRKINAILLNIKINQLKLVSMYGYKLASN